jgi:hypothetical protein
MEDQVKELGNMVEHWQREALFFKTEYEKMQKILKKATTGIF